MNIIQNKTLSTPLKSLIDDRGVLRLTLSRPEIHNAFDDKLIKSLFSSLKDANQNPKVRIVVIAAEGKSFSAGADLNWMKRMADGSFKANLADAKKLASMLSLLDTLTKPVIAEVQGTAIGGGVGLIAASDIAISSDQVFFALSEVRLGLIPATISPYVLAAIGQRAARRWFLSGERFDVKEAIRIGLIHEAVPSIDLRSHVDRLIEELLHSAPKAITTTKILISQIVKCSYNSEVLIKKTAKDIAKIRKSDEAKEGIESFLKKRMPKWVPK